MNAVGPSLRYQKAQTKRHAANAAARAEAQRRGYELHPRTAEVRARAEAPKKEHAALLRDLATMAESHLRDGNRRTAHCLSIAARVITELQDRLDRHAHNAHPTDAKTGTSSPVSQDVV